MPNRRVVQIGLTLCVVYQGLAAPCASAWSAKEHMLLTRVAAERLSADPATPAELRRWLADACPDQLDLPHERAFLLSKRVGLVPRDADGVTFWSTVPDLEAAANTAPGQEVQPFNVNERLLHYIDIEFFVPDESKRRYADDLSGKPSLADFPRDMRDARYARAGMLPFRVEQCYQNLVRTFARAGSTTSPASSRGTSTPHDGRAFLPITLRTTPSRTTQPWTSEAAITSTTCVPRPTFTLT